MSKPDDFLGKDAIMVLVDDLCVKNLAYANNEWLGSDVDGNPRVLPITEDYQKARDALSSQLEALTAERDALKAENATLRAELTSERDYFAEWSEGNLANVELERTNATLRATIEKARNQRPEGLPRNR